MFGFSTPALLTIGAIFMLFFGVRKLPELGSSIGKAITNFKKAANDKDQVDINPKKAS